jgi:hypothetical protein
MAKRQSTTERTSPSRARGIDGDESRTDPVPESIDEARAEAHERARQRSGSDD